MKKYLLYTDVHWSTTSSIINSRGEKYSTRLENLIDSINWAEQTAKDNQCDEVICLGDFFNKPDLTSEEVTALQEIIWADLPHTFIVGNHESPHKELRYNSVRVLQKLNFDIITEPKSIDIINNFSFIYLPYMQDDIRKSIEDYKKMFNIENKRCIVLSHNDIAGINYGPVVSTSGINLEDIENNCALFLNGHIHNWSKFCKNGFNLGNLTGANFSEDADKYQHLAWILEVDEINGIDLLPVENPYAFKFYQRRISKSSDIKELNNLPNNSVVIIRCNKTLVSEIKEFLVTNTNIKNSRIIVDIEVNTQNGEQEIVKLNEIDYLQRFKTFVMDKLGNSDDIMNEINKIIVN